MRYNSSSWVASAEYKGKKIIVKTVRGKSATMSNGVLKPCKSCK